MKKIYFTEEMNYTDSISLVCQVCQNILQDL